MVDAENQELPSEWLEQDHFDVRVAWFSRQPSGDTLQLQEELRQGLVEQGKRDEAETFSLELAGHPGWWMHFNVEQTFHGSLEEALAAAKTILKRSELEAGSFNFKRPAGTKAPVHVSKSQRRKLIGQIMGAPAREPPEGIVREAFLEMGDYALSVWIESVAYREEFHTSFGAAENPLRSLTGRECSLEALSYEDSERDGEEDWQEVARGELALEDDALYIGEWSYTFEPEEPVYGVAFEWAELEAEALRLSLHVEAVAKEAA